MTRALSRLLVLVAVLAVSAFGQTGGSGSVPDDPMAAPTEYGIRLTPAMARAIGGKLTEELFVREHNLDKSKADKVSEMIARRLMQFVHQNEVAGQDLAEFAFTELMVNVRENHGHGLSNGIPRRLAQGLGVRLVPIMPSIRDLTNGIMQDVRPELSFKEQLKLTGEVTLVNVVLDTFEKNMQGWAKGDVDPFASPFEDREAKVEKDEKGESAALRHARRWAEGESKKTLGSEWQKYVEEAKKYYGLDASQAAAADSVLRDYQRRAEMEVGSVNDWRAKRCRNSVFSSLSGHLPGGWQNNPMRILVDRESEKMKEPLDALEDEMKARLEEIPTAAQREAGERRVRAAFVEIGLDLDEPPATAPAEEAAK